MEDYLAAKSGRSFLAASRRGARCDWATVAGLVVFLVVVTVRGGVPFLASSSTLSLRTMEAQPPPPSQQEPQQHRQSNLTVRGDDGATGTERMSRAIEHRLMLRPRHGAT